MEEYQWLLDDPDVEVLYEITDFGVGWKGFQVNITCPGRKTQNCIALFIAENDKIPVEVIRTSYREKIFCKIHEASAGIFIWVLQE